MSGFEIGIVADIRRRGFVDELAGSVRPLHVSWDVPNDPVGCFGNHLATWRAIEHFNYGREPWLVVLEDDAAPVEGFSQQLGLALSVAPAPVVSLYMGTGHPRRWQRRYEQTLRGVSADTCWAKTSGWLLHAVGVAIRAPLVPGMLFHVGQMVGTPIDAAVGQWARNVGHEVAYALPSLVDHRDGETIHPHLDGRPRPPGARRAWAIGSRDKWTSKSVVMG